jgi:hypothetical protein
MAIWPPCHIVNSTSYAIWERVKEWIRMSIISTVGHDVNGILLYFYYFYILDPILVFFLSFSSGHYTVNKQQNLNLRFSSMFCIESKIVHVGAEKNRHAF